MRCTWRRRARISVERPAVIPGRLAEPNPESRGSGFDASHRPGTTGLNYPVFRNPAEIPLMVS
ncbi:hypothetical protein FXB41_33765 [Bradyrhizobium canariense]|nr:hypothetical protein [Bradyrhizobium canariense]